MPICRLGRAGCSGMAEYLSICGLDRAGYSGFAVFYRKHRVLARLHRMGWAGLGWGGLGLQSRPISVAEYSASSGRGPAAVGRSQRHGRCNADEVEGTPTRSRERRGGVDVPSTSSTSPRPCRCRSIDRAGEEALGQSERRSPLAMFWSCLPGAEP